MTQTQVFDTSKELLVQRYKQGVRLIRPKAAGDEASAHTIAALFNLPASVYFKNPETKILDLNNFGLEVTGAQSANDVKGKMWADFASKSFGDRVQKNDQAVITAEQMQVLEESGIRCDRIPVDTISIKFPCYQNEKIMGLLGFSIKVDKDHIGNFGHVLSKLMLTGLLSQASPMFPPALKNNNFYFSHREREVLHYLVRGKTAKEIGLILAISKRTAENHIKNLKSKSHCGSKSELIDKYFDQFSGQ